MHCFSSRRQKPGGVLERQSLRRLLFPEIAIASLGYSEGSNKGRGVSQSLARQLYTTAKEVVDAGIKDPAIFELAVVFEEGFGPDLISDMTLFVILEDVSAFNKRVCNRLNIPTISLDIGTRSVTAAWSEKTRQAILLIPRSLLSELPEATSHEDIDRVLRYNEELRERLNKRFGENWSNLVRRLTKRELRDIFIHHPRLLKEWLKSYKERRPTSYDFDADPLGEVVWDEIGRQFANEHQLQLDEPQSPDELTHVVTQITTKFKRLVEKNGLCKHLYTDDGKQRPEKFAQLLFYAVADSYCEVNNFDLSAEPNAGRGPVDFKLSRGYHQRATVEIKLSSNGKALDGLLAQLPEYSLAEQSIYDCYLLIVVGPSRAKVDEIIAVRNKLLKKGQKVPRFVLVEAYDAYYAPSASKLSYQGSWWN